MTEGVPKKRRRNIRRRFPHSVLLRELGAAGLADDVDLDLSRIFQLIFNALGDLAGEHIGALVGDVLRLDHDAHLAAGLNRERLFHAREAVGNLLQLFETTDVVLDALAARTRTSRGNRVGRLNEHGLDGLRLDIVVVRRNAVDDLGGLVVGVPSIS